MKLPVAMKKRLIYSKISVANSFTIIVYEKSHQKQNPQNATFLIILASIVAVIKTRCIVYQDPYESPYAREDDFGIVCL